MIRLMALSIIVILAILLSGCSGSGNPVTNPSDDGSGITVNYLLTGVSDWNPDGTPAAGMGALGLFQLHIDPQNVDAELTPLRKSSLTDVLEVVDITNFLMLAPCTDCVKVRSVELDPDGHPVLNIGIKHPFVAGDPFKPISGRNRADLHVFNVEGIVISNAPPVQFPSLGRATAGFNLVNASGYTGYLDSVLDEIYATDATIHPYILHFNDYSAGNYNPSNPNGFESVTNPGPSGNLVMRMGSDYDFKSYVFSVTEPVDFIFAVGCTYAVSASSKSMRFNPEYRIPQHNKKAASEVSVQIVTNDLIEGDTNSQAELEIHVVDINHKVEVGTALNQMFADSSVGNINIEIPAIVTGTVIIDGNNSLSGSGHDPSDPLIYKATVQNELGATQGTYHGLIKVTDTYSPHLNTSPLLNGLDGIKRVGPIENPLVGLFDIDEFATYQTFDITVGQGCIPPVVISVNPDVLSTSPGLCNDVQIIGQYFTGSGGVTRVYLDNSVSQIDATDIVVISDTELSCDLNISTAQIGFYDVAVVTACEGRGDNLVQITGFPPEWMSTGYNNTNHSTNPNPQAIDPMNMTRVWMNTTSAAPSGFKTGGVVIADGKVFFMGEPSSYYYASTNYSAYCLDLDDGHEIWRAYINEQGEISRSLGSLVWYENKVYAGGDEIHCFDDETGELIWSYNGTPPDNWCFISESPKVLDGKVYCHARWGAIVCLDAETGEEIWVFRSYTDGEMICATDGERLYVPASMDLFCLNCADGTQVWKKPIPDRCVAWSGPVIMGDRVYQCGWYGSFNCFDKVTGDPIWTYDITQTVYLNAMPAPFIDPSDSKPVFVFGSASSSSPLWAIKDNGASPSVMWSNILGPSPYYDGSAITIGDYILVGDRFNAGLQIVDKLTGTLQKTYPLAGSISAQAASAFDRVVVTTDNSVECYM